MLWDIHFHLCYSQAPEFDRWSGSSREATDLQRQPQDKRRSRELQQPAGDDNPISPGYTEPLCVSVCPNSPNPLMSNREHDIFQLQRAFIRKLIFYECFSATALI